METFGEVHLSLVFEAENEAGKVSFSNKGKEIENETGKEIEELRT